jgi:hypothetical protein
MAKDFFLKSLSGLRYIRLSKVSEFKVSETCSFPEPFQVSGRLGVVGSDWILLFKGTKEECEAYLEGVLEEGE